MDDDVLEEISVYDISTKLSTTLSHGRLLSLELPLLSDDVDEEFHFCLLMSWEVASPKSSIRLDRARMRVDFYGPCTELQDLLGGFISHGESQARTLFGDLKNMRLLISIWDECSLVEFAPGTLWVVLTSLERLHGADLCHERDREMMFDGALKCVRGGFLICRPWM